MFATVVSRAIEQAGNLLDYTQLAAIAIVLLGAWLLQPVLNRLLNQSRHRMQPAKVWVEHLFVIVMAIKPPLSAALLNKLAIELFNSRQYNTGVLQIAGQLFGLWLLYRFLAAALAINLSPPHARFWAGKVVLPAILLGGLLSVTNLLGDVLNWGFTIPSVDWHVSLGAILFATLTVIIFLLLAKWVNRSLAHSFLPRAGLEPGLSSTVSKIIAYAIVAMGILISLNAIGINLTGLTVIAGGLSVGLAFGMQEIFNNFISGFIILFERSVEPGDVIEVGASTGVVQRVGIRSTTITTRDNVELIVPNSNLLTEVVTNMTRSEKLVRTRVAVGVSYSANPREVRAALLAAAQKEALVLPQPPPNVLFKDFGDSSLNFELLVWTDEAVQLPVLTSDLRYHIWDELGARNIEIPFPQRDIHIKSGIPWSALATDGKQNDQHS